MILILRVVLIGISLQMFRFRAIDGQPVEDSQCFGCNPEDVCDFSELDVKVAFTVSNFIVMIADVKSKSGQSLSRVAIRVFFVDNNGQYEYEQPERLPLFEVKEQAQILLYVFSTTNMEPVFWKEMGYDTQINKQIHYFVWQSEEGVSKEEKEIVVDAEELDLTFNEKDGIISRVNTKIVYNFSEPEDDETGLFNLKILYLHFPKGVHILDIVILERQNIHQNETIFHALVYTEEKSPWYYGKGPDHWFFARFYLKAKAKKYSNDDYTYERLDWQFDINPIDNKVCSDKGLDKVTAVIHVSTEHHNSGNTYNLIEFYSTHHKKVYFSIGPNGTLHSSQNDSILIDNKAFINCGAETTVPPIDETTQFDHLITSDGPTPDSEVCLFKEVNVSTAFTIDDYLVIIADVKTDKGLPLSRVAFRIFHTIRHNVTNSKGAPYFEANRWLELEKFDKEKRIEYIFSTTNMDPIFYEYMGDKANQINNQIHYFTHFFSFPTDSTNAEVDAQEFNDVRTPGDDNPLFIRRNNRTVYKFSERGKDETGFFNLKQLYYHFPITIRIIDMVILERKVLGEVRPRYHALVYTEEKVSYTDYFYARYSLSAETKTYSTPRYAYERLFWEFDYSYNEYDEITQNYTVCSDKSPQKVTAVVNLMTEQFRGPIRNTYVYHLIEFYETHHRYIYVLISAEPDSGLVTIVGEDNTLTENKLFLNCEKHRMSNFFPASDCRLNPKLKEIDFSQFKFLKNLKVWKDPIQSQKKDDSPGKSVEKDENWKIVWLILAIIAIIIGIIALISYEVFYFVSSQKQTK